MGDEGLEQPPRTPSETGFDERSGAESGAVDARPMIVPPELVPLVERWPMMPAETRIQVLVAAGLEVDAPQVNLETEVS